MQDNRALLSAFALFSAGRRRRTRRAGEVFFAHVPLDYPEITKTQTFKMHWKIAPLLQQQRRPNVQEENKRHFPIPSRDNSIKQGPNSKTKTALFHSVPTPPLAKLLPSHPLAAAAATAAACGPTELAGCCCWCCLIIF